MDVKSSAAGAGNVEPCAVRLKKGREKSVLRRHPWIFSGAVADEPVEPAHPLVCVTDERGKPLGFGLYSPQSQIRVRILSFGSRMPDISRLLKSRMADALAKRASLMAETNAVRMVNSEGDFLPGIILDKYADTLVLQILTAGVEGIRDVVIQAVRSVFNEPTLFEKSLGRASEGLPERLELIYGNAVLDAIAIQCGHCRFWVDIPGGQKSGFYFDQRRNIRHLRDFISAETAHAGKRGHLLDCFCYSGAFGVSLQEFHEKVTFVDSSEQALRLCEKNWDTNRHAAGSPAGSAPRPPESAAPHVPASPAPAEYICMDAFQYLRRTTPGEFDTIILDPPSFARRKGEVDGACRGYKDIFRLAMKHLRPGGILAVFCCSHHIDADLFQKVVFAAAVDADRHAQIVARFSADVDHPVSVDHPEGDYLKGLLLRVC